MIITSAPGRCGIIGNPTDMYGGSVISCSTSARAACTLDVESDGVVVEVSGERRELKSVSDLTFVEGSRLNVARAALIALEIDPANCSPFTLSATTDIPMQAGLAGSTAILASIAGCLLSYLELRLPRHAIAEMIRRIERDNLGIVCGFQDHYMATFGGINYMDFRDKNSLESLDANSVFATVENLESHINDLPFILAHTGVRHHSGSVHGPIQDRWAGGEKAVIDGMLEIGALARQGKRALLSSDWDLLGELMNRNHAIQKELGGSAESNDRLIAAALGGGALGAKLAGAGGGGTIIALAPEPIGVIQALEAAGAELYTPKPCPGLTIEVRLQ